MNAKVIYFDMDGTIADLYATDDWLSKLRAQDSSPYAQAQPLLKMQPLARVLNHLKVKGYTIGIISWLAKASSPQYDEEVTKAKIEWLNRHLKSVEFDEIKIVRYGTPKSTAVSNPFGILFDDEIQNRQEWKGQAYQPNQIMEILKALA